MKTPYTTKAGIQIGLRYQPAMPQIYGHALTLQTALLDKRTATPLRGVHRLFGALWAWL